MQYELINPIKICYRNKYLRYGNIECYIYNINFVSCYIHFVYNKGLKHKVFIYKN